MNNQIDKPGYGMQIKKGCTSLAERWDGGTTGWSSQDHFMSGQIVEWLYHDLAGIQPDQNVPAFKKMVIKPAIISNITWVKARYDSIQGPIVSEWNLNGDTLTMNVTIPMNTTALVYVPARRASSVMENARAAATSPGVSFLRFEEPFAVYAVGSGAYEFTTQRASTRYWGQSTRPAADYCSSGAIK